MITYPLQLNADQRAEMDAFFLTLKAADVAKARATWKREEPFQQTAGVRYCTEHRCEYNFPVCPLCLESINARDKNRRLR